MELKTSNQEGVLVVRLRGALVQVNTSRLESALKTSLHAGEPRIVLELSDVTFVDSMALGLLIKFHLQARDAGGDLKLVNVPPMLVDSLRHAGFGTKMPGFASIEAAIANFE
ncbi:MAG: STAS domain-containing protein [Spirochaetia bacterium]|nr:STAS domain-containing protein [Spirochaetia bacterium]